VDKLISEATVVRPGDTLVMVLNTTMTPEEFADFNKRIKDHLPAGIETLILSGPIQVSVLRGGSA
jgi:hypothetical protein